MRLRELELHKILKKIDEDITDWDMLYELEEVYELWSWHPGMG